MLARWTQRLRRTLGSQNDPRPASGTNQARGDNRTTSTETAHRNLDQDQETESDVARKSAAEDHRREVLLRKPARQRWNAAIKPRSQAFKEIVTIFEDKLTGGDMTIQKILDEYFTKYECDLVTPADKRHNRALAKIQRRNRARYWMLMRSQRFAPWADQATSSNVKLAMLWFGLPVAPFEFDLDDELRSSSDTADDVAEAETERRRERAAQNENSLRFLNSYGKRYFGRDNLRDPDPAFEAYYGLNHLYPVAAKKKRRGGYKHYASTSLRGGGLAEELVDMDVDDFNESDIDVDELSDTNPSDHDSDGEDEEASRRSEDVSLRGGATISQPLLKKALELSAQLSGPKDTPKPKPGVHFDKTASQTESPETGTAKGKEPARDPPPKPNPFIKHVDPRPQPPTQEQRQRDMREGTYHKPPSVHTDNKIPQNAPPVEKVLRFGSDNLPTISLGVLTPTEQRRLQLDHYHMRNILLERSQKCPYRGCDRVISLAEEERMQQHLAEAHTGDGCNFCDEVLYRHWTVNQRRAHFLKKHSELFLTMREVEDDNSFRAGARPHGRVDYDRESQWTYCARCGRNHTDLDAKADREHHDSVCYPGAPEGDWVACGDCGVIYSRTERHKCREVLNTFEWPYCLDCGLATGLFSDLYRGKHQMLCRGIGSEEAKYCPWCGLILTGSPGMKVHHVDYDCAQQPDGAAEGPLDEHGEPWPFEPPIEEQQGEEEEQEPPEVCTLCKKTIIHLDAHLLLKHIEDNHAEYTGFCIFCKLDYERRGWAGDRKKILLHLDDHIHDRREKMAADLVETLDLPFNHPYRLRALRQRDYAGVKDVRELEHTKQLYDRLWESSRKQMAESSEDKQQIAWLREGLLEAERKLAEVEKGLEGGDGGKGAESTEAAPAVPAIRVVPNTPAVPDTPSGPATRAAPATPAPITAAPATGQKTDKKDREKEKDKVKTTPARKQVTIAAAAAQTPPPTAEKRKAAARPSTTTSTRAAADRSYRPSGVESDASAEEAYRAEEARLRAESKRRRRANRDPSFRPGVGDDDDDDEEW